MVEMENSCAITDKPSETRSQPSSLVATLDTEDEKERTIAKAALSIAELGMLALPQRLLTTDTKCSVAFRWTERSFGRRQASSTRRLSRYRDSRA